MNKSDESSVGLESLLELDGWTSEVGGGFWVLINVRRVPPSDGRPHGINYALTLNRPGGERILGYDNAHYPPIGGGPARRSQRKGRGHDHRHRREKITWYNFESPAQLLEDFWKDVQELLEEEGVPWMT